jgi:hypothetical protein
VDERADTHEARLYRDANGRSREPVIADATGSRANRDNLGMGRRIARANRVIEATADDFTVE